MRAFFVQMIVGVLVTVGMASAARAQGAQPPKPEPVLREVLLQQWSEIGEKIVKMAEDFPEGKYEFRPVADVRTFADVLRHVAFWNQYVAKTARREPVDPKINELAKAEYPTKAAIVKALKSSLSEATAQLKKEAVTPGAKRAGLWVTFTEHSGEHYGQLVVYYRLNGIVPPASRGTN